MILALLLLAALASPAIAAGAAAGAVLLVPILLARMNAFGRGDAIIDQLSSQV